MSAQVYQLAGMVRFGVQQVFTEAAHLLAHHQQWPAAQIVHEILHDAWQWHASVRITHLRHQPCAAVDLDVAVDVQIARVHQADLEPMASQQCPQVHRLALLAELVHRSSTRESEYRAQLLFQCRP